jgi:hypothetical protein
VLGKNIAFLVFFCLAPIAQIIGQNEEPIKESVSVINVEVPVRVFFHGQIVPGLSRDDFEISEDGKLQQINGFYVLRKRIDESGAAGSAVAAPPPAPGRCFVLVFRTYEFNEQLKSGIDYLFKNILLPNDQVLILANDKDLSIARIADDDKAQEKICALVQAESRIATHRMLGCLQQIEQSLNYFRLQLSMRDAVEVAPEDITRFLQSYRDTWRDFKRLYLLPDLDRYYYFARQLERVKKEKWVLNFFQMEQFPHIVFTSDISRYIRGYLDSITGLGGSRGAMAGILKKLLQSIEMEMKVADDFPSAEVSKLFYKVNATFHSFFMSSAKETGNPELQFRQVATDIENSLRLITKKTGGSLLASNNLTQSLATVAQKEDLYYMLTYEPRIPNKIGKIKVGVKNNRYEVSYDDNMRADYISAYLQKKEAENPCVKIINLSFRDKKLSLAIMDFSRTRIEDEDTGKLRLRIRMKNNANQALFDQAKDLRILKNIFSLSLDCNFLVAGKYDIIVDVLDQVSGKTCTGIIQPLIE